MAIAIAIGEGTPFSNHKNDLNKTDRMDGWGISNQQN